MEKIGQIGHLSHTDTDLFPFSFSVLDIGTFFKVHFVLIVVVFFQACFHEQGSCVGIKLWDERF